LILNGAAKQKVIRWYGSRNAQDEKKARDQLQTQWSQFESTTKSACTRETSIDGTPSYVELLTCLEMARDAKKLEKPPAK
jgi:hypothetical protein